MAAVDALQHRQFGAPQRSISPDDVAAEAHQLGQQRKALLEKPGELVRSPRRVHG